MQSSDTAFLFFFYEMKWRMYKIEKFLRRTPLLYITIHMMEFHFFSS